HHLMPNSSGPLSLSTKRVPGTPFSVQNADIYDDPPGGRRKYWCFDALEGGTQHFQFAKSKVLCCSFLSRFAKSKVLCCSLLSQGGRFRPQHAHRVACQCGLVFCGRASGPIE